MISSPALPPEADQQARIADLEAEVERLRAALSDIRAIGRSSQKWDRTANKMQARAHAALLPEIDLNPEREDGQRPREETQP